MKHVDEQSNMKAGIYKLGQNMKMVILETRLERTNPKMYFEIVENDGSDSILHRSFERTRSGRVSSGINILDEILQK